MDWLTFFAHLMEYSVWPIAIASLAYFFHEKILNWLQHREIKLTASGMDILFKQIDTSKLYCSQRKELESLSANEIWALSSFDTEDAIRTISSINPAQKVMAVTLIDAGAVEKIDNKIRLTPLGKQLLNKAKNIL